MWHWFFGDNQDRQLQRSQQLQELFRPVGKMVGDKLVSFDLGYYDSILFEGRTGDTLLFTYTRYEGKSVTINPKGDKHATWPLSSFDLDGVTEVVIETKVMVSY